MRTTFNIDDHLLAQAEILAVEAFLKTQGVRRCDRDISSPLNNHPNLPTILDWETILAGSPIDNTLM
ncbi:hypothetical protein I546_3258 [Mycobacterium kansasii 732]|uniref:Uncharacterized protein n=1 Tax=Mycobacterium pseudokansasii TaxID=2341080 RepID=A0A498QYE8_9MYCO|nr:DUF2191 domain-containing protein [Mycobacterium pseudokansasii]EUA11491.1 hypothetical protein I546_3258 [Mycobacterium kansasii 732]VBA30479.1 hypothetical protein LAUMK35_04753 [Mycobacterium pseudokansasii]VBA32262.1 hypothetical protein LAUMK21_04746 [Mycobacterium pseudokansasii]VBA54433.1 hypothetical protein LAUMK142_04655 [Mycobacterium pseudokansasii]